MPPSRARTTTALALLLLAATACTAGEPGSAPAPGTAAPSPAARQTGQRLRLPLDAYVSDVAETHAVEDAQDVLMRPCMNALGLEWKPLPRVDARDLAPWNLGRYGADAADAVRHGYHSPPDPPSVVRRDRAWDERDALPDRVLRAAYGPTGRGGCLEVARRRLVGDTAPPDYGAYNQLTGTALETSRRTPEVRAAAGRWSACMAEAGFDYPDPLAAATDERWRTPEPTPAERATARADAACQRTSGVMAVWAAAETRVQHGLIRRNADRLREAKARKDRWLAAARRVLDR
ncbi:hypothetical protein [Streptomyces roseolilacinus]|uniref:Lipoprotein n=1 Tax=Streptomyces roseolilacinus TaxID=66904 RepID=A0A918B6R1_9ACTN|nr:hypothetical protein [Streptomyces roseolilacinus]GGQ21698.1 hypothetical protein GCM10010249_45580 [Streptomyces roseolilacinus]